VEIDARPNLLPVLAFGFLPKCLLLARISSPPSTMPFKMPVSVLVIPSFGSRLGTLLALGTAAVFLSSVAMEILKRLCGIAFTAVLV